MYLRIFLTIHLVLAIHFPSSHPSEKFHVSYHSWSLTRSAIGCLKLWKETAHNPDTLKPKDFIKIINCKLSFVHGVLISQFIYWFVAFYICERPVFVPDFMCKTHETNRFAAFYIHEAIVLPNTAKNKTLVSKKLFTVIIKISEFLFLE